MTDRGAKESRNTSSRVVAMLRWWPLLVPLALWMPSFLAVWHTGAAGFSLFLDAGGLSAFFWLIWFALWSRIWIALAAAIPFALVWPLELWVRVNHGTPISAHIAALVWETGWQEGADFAAVFGPDLVLPLVLWFAIYGAALHWAWRHRLTWQGRARTWILAIGLPLAIWSNWPDETSRPLPTVAAAQALVSDPTGSWGAHWEGAFPANLVVAVHRYSHQLRSLRSLRAALAGRSLHAVQTDPGQAPQLVVLVIGESASASHWGALGYARDTTPRIASLPGVALFSDVVALSPATRSAVPGVLSRRPVLGPDDRVDLQAEPSLVKAFAETGYSTHWISNQAPLGRYDTSIGLYAHGAQDVRFLNPSTYDAAGNTFDETLLKPLRRILAQDGRQFIVVHLLGSHFDYSERYPPEFDHFRSSQKIPGNPGESPHASGIESTNDSYDNSIRYTDHILGEIIETVQSLQTSALVAYFSDHGVDPSVGACRSTNGARRSEEAYRVPLFVWLSARQRTLTPDYWQRLTANTHQPYTTRALYSTLLELASINIEGGRPAENLLHPPAPGTRRMVGYGGNLLDFDAARQRNPCRIGAGG